MGAVGHGWRAGRALLALSLVLLAGCGPGRSPQGGGAGSRLTVLTTVLPITLFTRAVAGDCAEVRALIPPGSGPHDFQARPSDLAALGRAQVLVRNGLGLEAFLDRFLATADLPRLRVIDSSAGIATIRSSGADHGHAGHGGHDHAGDRPGEPNPHIWLDPLRAIRQVETIRDGLVAADPACADRYRRNAARTVASLQRLDADVAAALRPYRGKTFVALHDIAPYFAQRYGLRAESLVDVPEANPSPADLQRVAGIVRRSQLRALLSEPQASAGSFNALARDLGIRVSEFDGLETGSTAMEDSASAGDPGAYLSVMRTNVSRLRQAFGG
jgi:zinc/manganese transport system substrate-binding protein